jgi:hypothetical protein
MHLRKGWVVEIYHSDPYARRESAPYYVTGRQDKLELRKPSPYTTKEIYVELDSPLYGKQWHWGYAGWDEVKKLSQEEWEAEKVLWALEKAAKRSKQTI